MRRTRRRKKRIKLALPPAGGKLCEAFLTSSRWQRRMCKRKSRAFIHGRFHNIMLTFRFEYSNILVQCPDEKLQIVRLVESEEPNSAGCCGGSLALFGFHSWLFGLWPYVNRFDVWPCSVFHAGAGGAYTVLHRHHRLPSEKRRFLPFGGAGRRITLRPCRSGRGDFYTICSRWQQSGARRGSSSARKAG